MLSAGRSSGLTGAIGLGLGAVGAVMVGVGLKARCDVRAALTRERITATGGMRNPGAAVRSPEDARALAEVIRRVTVDSADGRTYSETPPYLGPDGKPTREADGALRDEHTGRPVANPDYELWVSSTALQTALMQAYVGFRVAEFTAATGAALAAAGAGIALAGRH